MQLYLDQATRRPLGAAINDATVGAVPRQVRPRAKVCQAITDAAATQ